jgi:hypothetical protein
MQKSHIQLFSTNIKEVEKRLSRLKDIDQKIRIIANLERGQESPPFIGMGGLPSPAVQRKLKRDPRATESLGKTINPP